MAPSKKIMLFVCLLVVATAVVVPAAAQRGEGLLGGVLGGLGGVLGGVLGPVFNALNSVVGVVQGTLFCSTTLNATVGSSGNITSPPLSNVTVQLRCGSGNGTLVASATTGPNGQFLIMLNESLNLNNLIPSIITQILSGSCRLVVATPIAQCNATTPTVGNLTAILIPNGTTTIGPICIIGLCLPPIPNLPLFRTGPFV